MQELARYLSDIPNGAVLVLTVVDEAGFTHSQFDELPEAPDVTNCDLFDAAPVQAVLAELATLGAVHTQNYCYRDSYAFAAIKGSSTALAEALSTDEPATIQFALPAP
jgi:hypothetical protein